MEEEDIHYKTKSELRQQAIERYCDERCSRRGPMSVFSCPYYDCALWQFRFKETLTHSPWEGTR